MTGARRRRRARQLVWATYTLSLIVAACLIAGPVLNDRQIATHHGRALARVLAVTPLRTTIEYQDAAGQFHNPPGGVLYPGNLGPGQLVWVNYSTANPDLVKVEGRTWRLALLPAGSVAATSSVLAGLLLWRLRRRDAAHAT
ncbi:DUF3592 domain-containing protein [Corynebacterium sp. 13CS0277]|uniref:DUF3592 domain-containing protein n=1 Tax=Corynebacterium sp. 13CS0277 TaxID=2071994 RepID=UPI000D047871|nr:DUF3592 domain-containing protein [Corynebacterium sp. 13CS0277]PRQ10655.1 DUF3592 domain-containing protein [Corynebacterium sp. 13CS0277]